jgi:hypothetical protein
MRSVSPHQVAEGIALLLVTAFAIIQPSKSLQHLSNATQKKVKSERHALGAVHRCVRLVKEESTNI